jgi:hypothetical protein
MGFRFQKRIKLLPGLTLNLSKKGVSTSLGVTGARVTYGHGRRRTTVGLPGSGLSNTSITTSSQKVGLADDRKRSTADIPRSPQRTDKAQATGRFVAGLVRGLGPTGLVLGIAFTGIAVWYLSK